LVPEERDEEVGVMSEYSILAAFIALLISMVIGFVIGRFTVKDED
jgi:uncharacterized membrane-anchored protein YhcB (DUF1043 family)